MRILTDKQVGELWRRHDEHAHEYSRAEVRELILKLIEERATGMNVHFDDCSCWKEPGIHWKEACADFDIPYDEYLKAKVV